MFLSMLNAKVNTLGAENRKINNTVTLYTYVRITYIYICHGDGSDPWLEK